MIARLCLQVGTYAFTTLHPQLGVLSVGEQRTVIADIPGLTAGASDNRGLGHAFLRHIERTSILAFVVDLSTGLRGCDGLQPSVQLKMLQVMLCPRFPDCCTCSVALNCHRHNAAGLINVLSQVQDELYRYSPLLLGKPGLVVANKTDLLDQQNSAHAVGTLQQSTSLPVIAVSALEQKGISALIDALTKCDFPPAGKDI